MLRDKPQTSQACETVGRVIIPLGAASSLRHLDDAINRDVSCPPPGGPAQNLMPIGRGYLWVLCLWKPKYYRRGWNYKTKLGRARIWPLVACPRGGGESTGPANLMSVCLSLSGFLPSTMCYFILNLFFVFFCIDNTVTRFNIQTVQREGSEFPPHRWLQPAGIHRPPGCQVPCGALQGD